MKILLSNDDGVTAKGIAVLYQALSEIASVTLVAPDRNCSGASNSLTLLNPLRATKLENGFISINGTPTDCVQLGLNELLDELPDLVVAGINNGANLGFEQKLWSSADKLRSNMDAAEYKHVVLG